MNKPIELMRECNQILLRLHDINKHQLQQLRLGDFNKLDLFADKRQAVLEMLEIVEEQLDRKLGGLLEEEKSFMAKELSLRKEILQGILEQEMSLHKMVEQEKTKTILEIHSNQKNKKVVSAYKSESPKSKPIIEV